MLLPLAVIASLPFIGILRTALWLLHCLLIENLRLILAASVLSAIPLYFLLCPWRESFDRSLMSKERRTLFLFLTGGAGGILLQNYHWLILFLCAAQPLLWDRIFWLLRLPLPQVHFAPQWLRWVYVLIWAMAFFLQLG